MDKMKHEIVKDFYSNYYSKIFNSTPKTKLSFVSLSYRLTHYLLEKRVPRKSGIHILEIGAGSGEHLRFVKDDFLSYTMVDIIDPDFKIADQRLRYLKSDVDKLNFPEQSFDRIIITCVLHHLEDPYSVISQLKKWLKVDGNLSIFLPCDPGLAVRVNRYLFVSRKSRKYGFAKYDLFNALEHKNHVWGLEVILKEIFDGYDLNKKYYPFYWPSKNLNLFSIWQIRRP